MISKQILMLGFVSALTSPFLGQAKAAESFVLPTIQTDGFSLGRENAPVTLVEFSGYDCFYCRRHNAQVLPQIVKTYVETGKLRYVVHEFPPQDINTPGFRAAEAARCAADQGKYWEMRKTLFDRQKELTQTVLTSIATNLKLNMQRFEQCLSDRHYAKDIQKNYSDAKALGLGSIPGFYLGMTDSAGSHLIRPLSTIKGSKVFSVFRSAIEGALFQAASHNKIAKASLPDKTP